ncbi:protein still life, isoform SIF type 1-like isoform X4 [Saccostrea echinata]|uniref:protein still life, isoform SIF type 1-like isoform X4 n=1 Tax=Saccostrea echinata TaxID=191078 RepID=UPI002A832297|nr:protein still life, isoform SIF type 1-like isoform X4 [Saccostrea echinata]XP_061171232.1 protein still life, isoform SIF type 1-like isoform X4 [Saccostrea echinata]
MMGNKLCAPLLSKKPYREDQYPWQHSKDSHLLRLWAEIFRVHGDGDYMRWERVSLDVVPVNISCIEDTPTTVFQITAYNKHVEKIFDVKIIQPGTIICPATESFVHWRDPIDRCEWGLNFTTPADAQRFRDCCTNPSQKFSRKANSASSLRLSPPKKVKGKDRSVSSPNSPTRYFHHHPSSQPDLRSTTTHHHHHHHPTLQRNSGSPTHNPAYRAASAPQELSGDQSHDPVIDRREKAATIPRGLTEPVAELQTFKPIGILKPPSTSSVYDNVTGTVVLRKTNNTHDTSHRKSMPAAVSFVDHNILSEARPASAIHFTHKFYQSQEQENSFPQVSLRQGGNKRENHRKSNRPVHIETAFVGDNSFVTFSKDQGHRISYIDTSTTVVAPTPTRPDQGQPGVKEFPREEISQSDTTAVRSDVYPSPLTSEAKGHQSPAENRLPNSENFSLENLDRTENNVTPGSVYKVSVSATGVNGVLTVSRSSLSGSSSESPEWPSPPEPLTPMTPLTPECQVEFDSNVLKRMLQSLPVSPEDPNMDNGYRDDPPVSPNSKSTKSGLGRTKSLNTHDRVKKQQNGNQVAKKVDQGRPSRFFNNNNNSKSRQTRLLIEEELKLRDRCVRDSYGAESYPDSGIGGMSVENAGSVWSGNRLEVNPSTTGAGSSGASSRGSSSSGRHSDLINQLSDTSEIRQCNPTELWEDDGAESDDSIHTMTEAESRVCHRQSGAIRKAGWLVVKNWLIHRKRKLELAPRRKWKRYWVCLKGTVLLFYDCSEETAITEDSIPRHILVIESAIAQAVPEHPKRDNIFSVSTAFGDAYLFEATSLMEQESWICAVHSACASSFARQHGKDNTLRLMKKELHKLETNIDVDLKMRKMAELQLTVVKDPRSRQAIIRQIGQWEENLEKLFIEQYRFRCYIASLQGTELPNPKVLLGSASKTTKSSLGRLGVFTVTSFHALVAARKPLTVPNIYGRGKHQGGMLSPKGDGTFRYHRRTIHNHSPDTHMVYKATDIDEVVADLYMDSPENLSTVSDGGSLAETVALPNNQTLLIKVNKQSTAQDLLESVCNQRQLDPQDHYVRITQSDTPPNTYIVLDPKDNIKNMKYESIEVCQKSVVQLHLVKSPGDTEFGFTVEAELAEDFDKDDELRLYVSQVTPGSVAHRSQMSIGDEILVINGKIVSDLDMVYIETLLHESKSLVITVRSLKTNHSQAAVTGSQSEISSMMCPPPPSQSRIPENIIENLTVPSPQESCSPDEVDCLRKPGSLPDLAGSQIDQLIKNAEQVTSICRTESEPNVLDGHIHQNSKSLSEAQKLRKVIMELIETERAYVKDLNCLTEQYLIPLQSATFLTSGEIQQLFGNIQEIVAFQRQFLISLEEAIQLQGEFFQTEDPKVFRDLELRRVLFSLGGSFLYYANHFKVYSSFCASHSRTQKILNPVANDALKAFLHARNPEQQHSATLESYLIKPIQRILKYPLLLQQLCNLTDPDTDEHHHLSEANKGMEAVAEHINEMQKIFEEYGTVFDELCKVFRDTYPHKKAVDLSVGELQMYGTVEWCNLCDSLGKIKKGLDLENIVFVFKSGVVFVCREKIKKKVKTKDKRGVTEIYECQERFRTVIPVQEVQVQSGKVGDMDGHYWWDLIHSRSDKEGRPERVYEFCNSSAEAKSDFMKVIRQTIRESVRKMALPNGNQTRNSYVPYGGKRLESLNSNIRTLSKKRGGKPSQSSEPDRHSLEFEEKVTVYLDQSEPTFRTRSKTLGDLTDENNLEEAGPSLV